MKLRIATAILALTAGAAFAENPTVGGAMMSDTKNIVENASNAKDLSTLVSAIKAADLVKTLEGKGPFTVFAPTNEAFAKLPAGELDNLMKPENKEKLAKLLTCHVVAADDLAAGIEKKIKEHGGKHMIKTVGGCELTATEKDGKLMIEDGHGKIATVTTADVKQSNGVVHVIDTVLLPKS